MLSVQPNTVSLVGAREGLHFRETMSWTDFHRRVEERKARTSWVKGNRQCGGTYRRDARQKDHVELEAKDLDYEGENLIFCTGRVLNGSR